MQEINRCMGCMQELKGKSICTECSYNNEKQKNPERALPLRTILNGKYLIGKVIGEGGFGITYMAWDMLIGYKIAIKEYFPSELVTRDTTMQDEKSMKLIIMQKGEGEEAYKKGLGRFIKEAENLVRFQSLPGIVSVKDFFYENNTAYMVMEYVEGMTLKNYLSEHGEKLGVEQTFNMMEPVMKTLQEIHKEGIVHRDISPDNIMITKEGKMKLIDFGASRFINAEDEKSLTIILKHGYAPEEQYRSKGKQGPWTDVYALSATIYRMLIGKTPEEAIQRMTTDDNKVHQELKGMKELSDIRRKSLEKGLAVKAEKRYQSVEELYKGLYCEKRKSCKSIFVGIAAIVFLVIGILISYLGNIGKKEEVVYDNLKEENLESETLEAEISEIEMVMVMQEAETQEEEIPEPEYIRRLREYYNENYLDKIGQVYFVDLSGDGQDEMIVTYLVENENFTSIYPYEYYIHILMDSENHVDIIYETMETKEYERHGADYYLVVENEQVFLIEDMWNTIFDRGVLTGKISFNNDKSMRYEEISEEELEKVSDRTILLISSSMYTRPSWKMHEELKDYQNVLECKKELSNVMKIAEVDKKVVLDYAVVYNKNEKSIFAVTGKINQGTPNQDAEYDSNISVWNSVNDTPSKIKTIELNGEWNDDWQSSEIFQFGNSQHYFVEISGAGYGVQHKFVYEGNNAREIDSELYFVKDENGTVQMEVENQIEELNGEKWRNTPTYIDVFYYQNKYTEYSANLVELKEIEQYKNCQEILQFIKGEFQKVEGIHDGMALWSYDVNHIELDNIRRTGNNVYYLNFKVYGWDAEIGMEKNVWAHAVVVAKQNILEYKEIVFGEKKEHSNSGLPAYYD